MPGLGIPPIQNIRKHLQRNTYHVWTPILWKKPPHEMPIGSHKSLTEEKGETLNIPQPVITQTYQNGIAQTNKHTNQTSPKSNSPISKFDRNPRPIPPRGRGTHPNPRHQRPNTPSRSDGTIPHRRPNPPRRSLEAERIEPPYPNTTSKEIRWSWRRHSPDLVGVPCERRRRGHAHREQGGNPSEPAACSPRVVSWRRGREDGAGVSLSALAFPTAAAAPVAFWIRIYGAPGAEIGAGGAGRGGRRRDKAWRGQAQAQGNRRGGEGKVCGFCGGILFIYPPL